MIKVMLDNLAYWIYEREKIRVAKERGEPGPWTQDEYLANWRFCNVNRCHDRETRWIFKHVIDDHITSDVLWFNLAIARFLNWSPTLKAMGYFSEWEPRRFCSVIAGLQAKGAKVYTGAYMIRAGTGEDSKMPKHEYLVKRVFTPLWEKRAMVPLGYGSTCAQWDEFFGTIFGMGDFMRNQIITDMKYTWHLPCNATKDWSTFCLAGPGTMRGLNRLYGNDLGMKLKTDDANAKLYEVRAVLRKLYRQLPLGHFNDLNNLSNCFCEFDKFRRLIEGSGTPRSRYAPSSSPLP